MRRMAASGSLKLYVGARAATLPRLLDEARALRRRGVDVVVAWAHGEADGLPAVPPKSVEYRGVTVREVDVDAVLERRPAVAVVDELAHANAPVSKNRKRWQDARELLDAGIGVIGAVDVHAREAVPDSFVRQADELVGVNPSVEPIVERWQASRRVAERRPSPSGRVMVCMSSHPPHAATLLRRGSRLAGRLGTDWFVVYVETPKEAPRRIDAALSRTLDANIAAARELGAEMVRLHSSDPVACLLDFARSHGIGHIIIGSSQRPWWRQLFGRSIPARLVREARGFDLHIVSFVDEEAAP